MHTLPNLPYNYNALEPVIDEATMRVHHTKHHQAYIDKLNTALDQHPELKEVDLTELLEDLEKLPEDIKGAVRNHGGGHLNHSLFWEWLTPVGGAENEMSVELTELINKNFGSLESFKNIFKTEGLNRFGSGWVWLVKDTSGTVKIISTSNQDNPISQGLTPLLGVDVWEHAYYLKYQNKRGDYLDGLWSVINWQKVSNLAKI